MRGLTNEIWANINRRIGDAIQKHGHEFYQTKVTKNDPKRNVVFIKELGNQPIPIYAFKYSLKYYDTDNLGKVKVRHATLTPKLPKKGEIILIARQWGDPRLTKCIGVPLSTNFDIVTDLESEPSE